MKFGKPRFNKRGFLVAYQNFVTILTVEKQKICHTIVQYTKTIFVF